MSFAFVPLVLAFVVFIQLGTLSLSMHLSGDRNNHTLTGSWVHQQAAWLLPSVAAEVLVLIFLWHFLVLLGSGEAGQRVSFMW